MPVKTKDDVAKVFSAALASPGVKDRVSVLREDLLLVADGGAIAPYLVDGWVDDGQSRCVHVDVAKLQALLSGGAPAPAATKPAPSPKAAAADVAKPADPPAAPAPAPAVPAADAAPAAAKK